jgi:hypothetical protein
MHTDPPGQSPPEVWLGMFQTGGVVGWGGRCSGGVGGGGGWWWGWVWWGSFPLVIRSTPHQRSPSFAPSSMNS